LQLTREPERFKESKAPQASSNLSLSSPAEAVAAGVAALAAATMTAAAQELCLSHPRLGTLNLEDEVGITVTVELVNGPL